MRADGLILAGGKSRRMGGYHKGDLRYGQQTFLEHVAGELGKDAEHVWISYGAVEHGVCEECRVVRDEFLDCGPMGGLHAGLKACGQEYMMTAACDMPFLGIELYQYLFEQLKEAQEAENCIYMGAVPVSEGRLHPLAAVYRKGLEAEFGRRLEAGRYRLTEALEGQRILYVDVSDREDLRKMLMNVNTVQEYEALMNKAGEKERTGE